MENVIIALDVSNKTKAQQLIDQLTPPISFYKVGLELFTAEGNNFIQSLKEQNLRVFLDLKLHDIPNTVARTVGNIARYEPDMITVHTLGGTKMLEAAINAAKKASPNTKVLGVTILTSLDQVDLLHMGIGEDMKDLVLRLGQTAYDNGCDGLVCSASDLPYLREKFKPPFVIVTPGIRLADDSLDDQIRTVSARLALKNGADYLVIGRSITSKKQPAEVLKKLF